MEQMVLMMRSSQENPTKTSALASDDPICPTWKLYENPFYTSQNQTSHTISTPIVTSQGTKQIHRLHLPISARKIAASFWDLTFIRPFMDTELEMSRAQVAELKSKLEHERKARKKLESMNKKLAREVSEERKGREALERVCEQLASHVSMDKAEIDRLRKEMEEERKMLRVAEVMREERVQMKLIDAKFLLEQKLMELEETKKMLVTENTVKSHERSLGITEQSNTTNTEAKIQENTGHNISEGNSDSFQYQVTIHRRNQSTEPENPHIKRGIKGFVEFPKVVRAIGTKSRHWGTKLECQKAQLRILLKQKCPIRSNALLTS